MTKKIIHCSLVPSPLITNSMAEDSIMHLPEVHVENQDQAINGRWGYELAQENGDRIRITEAEYVIYLLFVLRVITIGNIFHISRLNLRLPRPRYRRRRWALKQLFELLELVKLLV